MAHMIVKPLRDWRAHLANMTVQPRDIVRTFVQGMYRIARKPPKKTLRNHLSLRGARATTGYEPLPEKAPMKFVKMPPNDCKCRQRVQDDVKVPKPLRRVQKLFFRSRVEKFPLNCTVGVNYRVD